MQDFFDAVDVRALSVGGAGEIFSIYNIVVAAPGTTVVCVVTHEDPGTQLGPEFLELLGFPFRLRLVLHAAPEREQQSTKGLPETVLVGCFATLDDVAGVAVVAVRPHGFTPPLMAQA